MAGARALNTACGEIDSAAHRREAACDEQVSGGFLAVYGVYGGGGSTNKMMTLEDYGMDRKDVRGFLQHFQTCRDCQVRRMLL